MSAAGSPEGPHVALIGFMGSGKTSVGRRLAALADRTFVDTDRAVEDWAGRTIAEVFTADGEAAFRALEHDTVVALLTEPTQTVLALGGGAAMHPGTQAALGSRAVVVHLRVSLSEALRRVGDDPRRPMLARPDLAELHAVREVTYDRLADLVVDVDGTGLDDVARHLVQRLGEPGLALPAPLGTLSPPEPTEIGLRDHP